MARQIIAVGSAGNDGTGDTLRSGAIKMNDNFEELYRDVSNLGILVSDSAGGLNLEGISFDQRSIVFIGVDSPNSTPSDTNETFLNATEPTKDNTITLPDSSGTVALLSDIALSAGVLDSQDILNFITTGIDSAVAITLISQNAIDSVGVINLVDAAYIGARVNPGLDSYYAAARIDEYVTKSYLVSNNLVLDSALVLDIIDSQLSSYLDSTDFNNLAQALEVSLLPDTDNARSLGSNTNRFSNAFIKQALEIDSGRIAYSTGPNLLDFSNVKTLRLNDGSDSGYFSVGTVGGKSILSFSSSLLPASDSALDLGDSNVKWKDLYLSGSTIHLGANTISSGNSGLRLSLAQYAEGSEPTDGKAGDLIILSDGDSATGGPTLAFKDSDNGTYVKFNTAAPSGGGGGGF